jgi:hypothetical protein
VAFREFAISINLGADPFEGGDLRFPEYNDHRYRLTVGGALIFSASVWHEVTPIIRGERTALLTFLHSDAAEARRQEYAGRIARAGMANSNGGGAYMANSQTVESTQMAR